MIPYCENPTEPLRIQKVENFRIAPHLHTSAELIYVEKGEALLTLGSLEFNLYSGDFALIMPSTLHSVTPVSEDLTLYVINTKCDLISDIIKRLSGLRPASPVLRRTDVPQNLLYAFSAVAAERDRYIAYSWIHLMFTLVVSGLRFAEIHDGVTSNLSNKVLSYLGLHYREQISLDQLAEAMGVSRFHLSHLFSSKLGIGFKEYLNNLRVEYAKGLLRTTDTPIASIYEVSGFENQRTFNRVFKENTGASPRDYRLGRESFGVPDPKKLDVAIPELDKTVPALSDIDIADEHIDTPLVIEEPTPVKQKAPRKPRAEKAAEAPKVEKEPKAEKQPTSEKAPKAEKAPEKPAVKKPNEVKKAPEAEAPKPKTKKNNNAWFF